MKRNDLRLGGLVRLAALMVALTLCIAGSAQKPYKYDSSHKYSLMSNWTLGVAGQYSNNHGGEYRVEGYSSPDGNSYNNQKLSGDRAFNVYQALIAYDVDKDRLIPMANGVTSQYGDDSALNRMVIVRKTEYGQ